MQRKPTSQRPETDREREARTRREEQPVVTRCQHCAESLQGSLKDGRAWHAEHMRKAHPKLAA